MHMTETALPRFHGSCHCGAVSFDVTMATPEKAYACNCSICSKAGWLLAFVKEGDFTLHHAPSTVQDYQFGAKRTHHFFCTTCGCRAYSQGTDKEGKATLAVNLRCVEGLDATKLPVETFDGASL
jgi:hypothetical protein